MRRNYLIITLLVICALVVQSCGKSREEKAEAIVKEKVPMILNDASTYEPIQTKIDSAFETIYVDPEAVMAAYELIKINAEIGHLKRQYNHEKSSAAIWSGSYMSTFDKEQLRQAKEKMGEIEKKLTKVMDDKAAQEQIIIERNKSVDPSKFIGWLISHRFRCANGFGTKLIQDVALLVDEPMENTLMLYNLDDNADDGFKNVKSVIDNVIEN